MGRRCWESERGGRGSDENEVLISSLFRSATQNYNVFFLAPPLPLQSLSQAKQAHESNPCHAACSTSLLSLYFRLVIKFKNVSCCSILCSHCCCCPCPCPRLRKGKKLTPKNVKADAAVLLLLLLGSSMLSWTSVESPCSCSLLLLLLLLLFPAARGRTHSTTEEVEEEEEVEAASAPCPNAASAAAAAHRSCAFERGGGGGGEEVVEANGTTF